MVRSDFRPHDRLHCFLRRLFPERPNEGMHPTAKKRAAGDALVVRCATRRNDGMQER